MRDSEMMINQELLESLLTDVEKRLLANNSETGMMTRSAISNVTSDVTDLNAGTKRSNQRTILGGGAGLIVVVSMFVGWVKEVGEEWHDRRKTFVSIAQSITTSSERQENHSKRLRAISEQLNQLSEDNHDGLEWLSDKINRMSSRARNEEMPDSVREMTSRKLDSSFSFEIHQ